MGEAPGSWTAGSGCDVFVLLGPKINALDYSERRFHEAGALYSGSTEHLMSGRVNYLREHRVEYVLSGIITMRKRKGVNWFASISGDISKRTSVAIQERLEAFTFVNEQTQEQWLDARLRFAPGTVINQTSTFDENGWQVTNAEVSRDDGISDQLKVDLPVLQALEMFDGNSTLREIIGKTSEALALHYPEAQARCTLLAKRLAQSGFVIPSRRKTAVR